MSADDDGGPGRREVAHRLFAAEFDDASLSYSESDEERAPNYVVTPTGARVNRLFTVGVLTEVEQVNEDVLRGRVVDPTGAFVTYAGQYQPDEMAFLERTDPPAFVALTGKARTFEPEDTDRVFTSVRPESVNLVDADTRDRNVVAAATATLERVSVFADALELDARGDDLRDALRSAGVRESLAAGIPLAVEHYGTTPAYLDAVRRLALDALEVVADERDEVRPLDVAPDEPGASEVGPIPEVGAPEIDAAAVPAGTGEESTDEPPAATAETDGPVTPEATAEASTATESSEESATPTEATEPSGESAGSEAAATSPPPNDPPTAEQEPSSDAVTSAAEDAGESDDLGEFEENASDTGASDDLGDFEESAGEAGESGDLGDIEAADDDTGGVDESGASDPGTDDAGLYELDDEERREVEEEFGTEFSSGTEVGEPGEAGIDVPDADLGGEDESASEAEPEADDAEPEPETDDTEDDEGAADVDLESVAVETMDDLDDGDGATREEVVAAVVDEYGADPEAVEDAIQSALMSGLCYEPTEDQLKAI